MKSSSSRWPALAGVLTVLYVCQLMPHYHQEPGPLESTAQPVSHGDHTHPHTHDGDNDAREEAPAPAHDHEFAQHLDLHFVRTIASPLEFDTGGDQYVLQPDVAIERSLSAVTIAEPRGQPPTPALDLPLSPRAPPATAVYV